MAGAGHKRFLIVNPTAGRQRAAAFLRRHQDSDETTVRETERPGHAEDLAREAALDGYETVGAAGGDGTIHEAANGILQSGRSDVVFQVIPVGSANDYAHSLTWDRQPHGEARPVDVGLVCGSDGRQRYFVNGLGLGFNCIVTRQARKIRFLRGIPLYGLALLRAMWSDYRSPRLSICMDGQSREEPTLSLTVNIGRREGNFVLAPHALVDDGWFDYLQAGLLPRWELMRHIPAMVTGNLPEQHPHLRRGRCREVQVASPGPLMVHLDGEFFCLAEDNVQQVEVRMLEKRLKVVVEV